METPWSILVSLIILNIMFGAPLLFMAPLVIMTILKFSISVYYYITGYSFLVPLYRWQYSRTLVDFILSLSATLTIYYMSAYITSIIVVFLFMAYITAGFKTVSNNLEFIKKHEEAIKKHIFSETGKLWTFNSPDRTQEAYANPLSNLFNTKETDNETSNQREQE